MRALPECVCAGVGDLELDVDHVVEALEEAGVVEQRDLLVEGGEESAEQVGPPQRRHDLADGDVEVHHAAIAGARLVLELGADLE